MLGFTTLRAAFVVICGVFLVGLTTAAFNQAAQPPEKKKAPTQVADDGVSAAEVVRVYRTNAAAADERFSFKPTRVTGRMLRIRNEGVFIDSGDKKESRYDLEMAGGERLDGKSGIYLGPVTDCILHFHTSSTHRAELAKLRDGQRVTMEGTPERMTGKEGAEELHFFNCKVIRAYD